MFGDRKLFERFIELVILRFGLYTSNIEFPELLYICAKAWSEISIVDEF